MKIFLYGPPGSGKSTLGAALAQALDLPFIDLDEQIVGSAGMSIPVIFEGEGEAGFRRRERAALEDALACSGEAVLALGGGALLEEGSRRLVEAGGQVLCLTAPLDTLYDRLSRDGLSRPLLAGASWQAPDPARLAALLARRAEHYASFPLHLDTSVLSPDESTWQAQVRLGAFRITGMGLGGYDVRIQPGGLADAGELLRQRSLGRSVVIVSDENTHRYTANLQGSLESAGIESAEICLPAGENFKNMETISRLWQAFLQAGLDRTGTALALGGGVIGDLTGFAAATYLRGIRWAALPTTLLAMCDASLGGKTGVDLPQGKNLVGAFHPPSLVLCDPHLLPTLPEAELRSGLGEVVKHGILGDPALFDLCRRGWETVCSDPAAVVRRAAAVKARFIQADPYEKGARAALNLGHTLGHAVEAASGYRLRHGEAVAIGLVAAARLSEQIGLACPGLAAEIKDTLAGLGLPTEFPPGTTWAGLAPWLAVDKKRHGQALRFVLPVKIGEVRWNVEVEPALIEALVNQARPS